MKAILFSTMIWPLLSVFLCTESWSHAGHEVPNSAQAPHLGEVKCTSHYCFELVLKGNEYTIYVYDHNLQAVILEATDGSSKPSPVQVTSALQLPNSNKRIVLPPGVESKVPLKITGQFKVPESHRYFFILDIVETISAKKTAKHVLKFQIEP